MSTIDTMTPADLRRMAAFLRENQPSNNDVRTEKLAKILGTLDAAKEYRTADSLREVIERVLAEYGCSHDEYRKRMHAENCERADELDRRALEIESGARSARIRVDLMTGDPKANESIASYETTLDEFLIGDGAHWGVDADDLRALDLGERETVHDRDGSQRRITRLADGVGPHPELVLTHIAPHAAHHSGSTSRPASDLAQWKVRSPSKPTADELRAIGVPADAAYNYGERDPEGRQYWYYARSQPAKDATCPRCAPMEVRS